MTDEIQDQPPEAATATRPGFLRRHRALSVLIALALGLTMLLGGWLFYLNNQLADIPRFDADLDRPDRPERVASDGMSILLAGVDDGQGTDLREALVADTWPRGTFRSDTIMILHLNADRSQAQLISIPRDSYVPVEGYGTTKINAAFSYGGPKLLASTVEDVTGLYIDHVAVVDLEGFRGITEAIGGVDLDVPESGKVHLEGEEALAYVRDRKSLPNGDFDRIQRQQNFMRAVLLKSASRGTLSNPIKLTRLVGSTTAHLAVDEGFDNDKIRSVARESRGLRANDIRFVTIPVRGTATIDGASVVRLNKPAAREMFAAVAKDQFESWYGDHNVEELPAPSNVD